MRLLLGVILKVFFAIGEGRHIPGSERRIFTDGSVTGDGKTGWLVMGYDRIERDGNNPGEQLRDLYSSVGSASVCTSPPFFYLFLAAPRLAIDCLR